MGEKDKDREKEYSPNPDFNEPVPREHPEVERERLYEYHRANGSMETYYMMYPTDRPWHHGLTADEKAAAEGRPLAATTRDGHER